MKASVTVEIRYLVTLRDRTGRKQDEVRFPRSATLEDVARWLKRTHDLSVPAPEVMATLNGRGWNQLPAGMETMISDGDVIALFPPIAGG